MKILIILMLVFLVACVSEKNEGLEPVTGQHMKELEFTACDAADKAGTCSTKLPSLGFITKETCCNEYEKCC